MKRLVSLLLLLTLLAAVPLSLAACGKEEEGYIPPTDAVYNVTLEVQDYGKIILELRAEYAPYTVDNFVHLVNAGFYDGLIFHRVIKDFMIQGGDPLGNGTGGADQDIIGEFAFNGIQNTLSHTRGVVSMARSGSQFERLLAYYGCTAANFQKNASVMQYLNYYGFTEDEVYEDVKKACNSASSQFFIVHQDSTSLDGNYAGFGRVISGMDVVDAIASVSTDSNYKPTTTVTISTAYLSDATGTRLEHVVLPGPEDPSAN